MDARVVIAYDGSSSADAALRAAASLFRGARAYVVTVPPPLEAGVDAVQARAPMLPRAAVQQTIDGLVTDTQRQAGETAEAGVERARANGLDAESRIPAARAPEWSALLGTADDLAADVLVCGTRGRSGFARALLGSTSSSLLHHTHLPLLIVPDGGGQLDGPAVIAYDGSHGARQAIEAAGRLLGARNTLVVHAWEGEFRRALAPRALAAGPVDELREIIGILQAMETEGAEAVTEEGVRLARSAGLDATGQPLESASGAWRTIASAARTHEAAVVVVGSRGLGGARSALLGSVSSGLVHNAEAPVLVVPEAAR